MSMVASKLTLIAIEKKKGPVVGKLRTIQLIKVGLQLIMRIGIDNRNKYKIKEDPRISKSNYGF